MSSGSRLKSPRTTDQIDLQSGHAYFALSGSTIRARDHIKKQKLILLLLSIASVVTDPARKVSPDDVSIRPFALVPMILLIFILSFVGVATALTVW